MVEAVPFRVHLRVCRVDEIQRQAMEVSEQDSDVFIIGYACHGRRSVVDPYFGPDLLHPQGSCKPVNNRRLGFHFVVCPTGEAGAARRFRTT
jgi:hypothetical protein